MADKYDGILQGIGGKGEYEYLFWLEVIPGKSHKH